MRKIALALLLFVAAAAFWMTSQHPIELTSLQAALSRLRDWRVEHAALMVVAAFTFYVLATALSLPLGVWLSLGMGALFGFWQGLILASFASSLGATLAFLAARHLARDWVRGRLGARADAIDVGLRRDGAFYLFSLRLIPVVPFFAVNLLMGLSPIRPMVFYLVSQIGMLPGTAVYVNAGTQLSGLTSIKGLVSPGLLVSFALLGLFPWLARTAIPMLKPSARPRRFDRNLIVIGGGSAGLVRATQPVAFRYTDLSGNPSRRTVLPLVLVHPPQGVKLLAWCQERQEFRQFFVREMQDVTAQPGDFGKDRLALLEGLLDKESWRD